MYRKESNYGESPNERTARLEQTAMPSIPQACRKGVLVEMALWTTKEEMFLIE